MKNNRNQSILGKYSDNKAKKKTNSEPKLANYEQRFKGQPNRSSLAATVTKPKPAMTLEEKIKAREEKKVVTKDERIKVPVEIAGNRYLLGADDNVSEERIRRIAKIANNLYEDVKANNPGLTNSKTAILALIDCVDMYITQKDLADNYHTEVMYHEQQERNNSNNSKEIINPTPLDDLLEAKGKDKSNEQN